MPIRFSTEAANADHLRMDAEPGGTPDGMSEEVGADGTPRDRGQARQPRGDGAKDEQRPGDSDVKPGKDANATGLVKDKDPGKP